MSGRPSESTLSRGAPSTATRSNALHRIDARAKIIGFVAFTVVVVTTPPRPAWPFVLYGAVLAFIAALARLSPGLLAKRALVVVPFVIAVAVFLPFFHRPGEVVLSLGPLEVTDAGLLVLWNAAAKALLGVTSMILLTSTTTFAQLIEGFERLRTPKVLVLTLSFMHRYGQLFLEESRRMQRAMASRNFRARWLGNIPTLGHMLGSLFIRSYNRGERVYVAMLSRGYEGTIRLGPRKSFGRTDVLFLLGILLAVAGVRAAAWIAGV